MQEEKIWEMFFPQAVSLTKQKENSGWIQLNSWLKEVYRKNFWKWQILPFQQLANKILQLVHSKCHSIEKEEESLNNLNTNHSS